MALKKPERPDRPPIQKPKMLATTARDEEQKLRIANAVQYAPSVYHCADPKTGRVARRGKPHTICHRSWSEAEARAALQAAIKMGWVSEKRFGEFPRFIWYREGETDFYEARSEPGTPERYHGYPITPEEVPGKLRW